MKLTFEAIEASIDKAAIKAALPESRFFTDSGQQYCQAYVGRMFNCSVEVVLLIGNKLAVHKFLVYKRRSVGEYEQHILRPDGYVDVEVDHCEW